MKVWSTLCRKNNKIVILKWFDFMVQLKLSTTATLGQKKVAIVERFKQELMYGLSAKKAAIVERWPLVEVRLYHC